MREITCDYWKHIKAGHSVATGYGNDEITAPEEDGFYTLYQLADDDNNHAGWKWEMEYDEVAVRRELGIITVDEFIQLVKKFGFDSPVVTAVWNTMSANPNNADEFETVYALWATGRFSL